MSAAARILISLAHTEAVPLGPVHRMTLRARNLINIVAIPCIRNAIVFRSSEVGRSSESRDPIAFRCRKPGDSPPPKIGRRGFLIIAGDLGQGDRTHASACAFCRKSVAEYKFPDI